MKKILLSVFFFSILISAKGQNLVPNGNFEGYSVCPDDISQLEAALNWITPTDGTSDYFNQCTYTPSIDVPYNLVGFQAAHSGVGYAGIFMFDVFLGYNLNYREYLEVPLTSVLVNDSCYHFEMYISLANTSAYAVSNIEVYFSETLISNIPSYDPLPFTPQITNTTGIVSDTLNWKLISGDYTANGGESYLLIGNFKDDSNTDTLFVNEASGNEKYAYYFIDDVSLSACNSTAIHEPGENTGKNLYPNPFTEKLTFKGSKDELLEIILYDIISGKMLQREFKNSVTINTEQLAKGIYIYEMRSKNIVIEKGKVVKE